MSITLIYIPKKYKYWERIPEDIRDKLVESTSRDINYHEADYEYADVKMPIANRDLPLAWNQLINSGNLTEKDFGFYEDGEEIMICPILQNMINLVAIIDIKIDTIYDDNNYSSSIINISSTKYLPMLTSVMIEELFK